MHGQRLVIQLDQCHMRHLRPLPGKAEGEIAVGGLEALQPARACDGLRQECNDHAEGDDPVWGFLANEGPCMAWAETNRHILAPLVPDPGR